MDKEKKQKPYISPKLKVTKVKPEQIICTSDPSLRYGGFSEGEEEGY